MKIAQLSGRLGDADAFLASITPGQLDELQAWLSLEPDWSGKLNIVICLLALLVRAWAGVKLELADLVPLDELPACFLEGRPAKRSAAPARRGGPAAGTGFVSPDQAALMFEAAMGRPPG